MNELRLLEKKLLIVVGRTIRDYHFTHIAHPVNDYNSSCMHKLRSCKALSVDNCWSGLIIIILADMVILRKYHLYRHSRILSQQGNQQTISSSIFTLPGASEHHQDKVCCLQGRAASLL